MKARSVVLNIFSVFLFMQFPVEAAFSARNERVVDTSIIDTISAEDLFSVGLEAIETGDWDIAALQFDIVATRFPGTNFGKEAYFYLGVANFYLKEFDYANESFSDYLTVESSPQFFQEAVEYKFAIANCLAKGHKKRYFGKKQLPKWACGKQLAIQIYDEVIAAMPCNQIAAQALISKGNLLRSMKDYRSAIESFQLVIRRFPKYEQTPDSYVLISKVYLEQCRHELNPDILALAQINFRKFSRDFPREERLCDVENDVAAIKEINARGLYETGQFYERTCKRRAAIIYYKNAIHQFPDTCIATYCRQRLESLDPTYCSSPENLSEEGEESENEESYDFS
jgi:outer membrane protein assembly factor BamD (BamD/ComL family)